MLLNTVIDCIVWYYIVYCIVYDGVRVVLYIVYGVLCDVVW